MVDARNYNTLNSSTLSGDKTVIQQTIVARWATYRIGVD